ncbi:alpha/beta hydrolase [Rhodococcus sp. T2V]|uniref:alpha/beta hydrolase n=1 Tax=Rhodococcus sp. T2V TaxID=3034164 RepID=UPI0023E1459D|nr:alpha/beta hydrolase [Rhodococcus sp. T2V]MDF3309164.1 alpha/beta hydrolase [Rhodococcus sp. T2V]
MALSMQAMLDLLDDDARAAAEALLRDAPAPPYSQYGVPAVRAMFDGVSRSPAEIHVPEVLDLGVGTPDGELTVRCYRPSLDRGLPVLMYVHGGGFVIGTLDGVDDLCRSLAVAAGCVVVSVEYRRAPEWVFPAAADDCLAVYDWLERRGDELGIDPTRLALAGDSAGGNLVLSVCTSLAAAGRPLPTCLVVAYPATSADFEGPSWEAFEHAPVLCKADAEWFWAAYADAGARRDPRAVPEVSTSLHSLPPMLVVSAEVDPLRSDYERFAELVACAGGEVEVRRYDGVAHGFFTEVRTLRKARRAVADTADFLRTHFPREPVRADARLRWRRT